MPVPHDYLFKQVDFEIDDKLCFVLMPFAKKFQPIYDDYIKPAVQKAGLTCMRADDLFGPRAIIQDIWEYIFKARVVIAELTDKNPNVFYEVGLSHTLNKKVILITQDMVDVPFDLKHLRVIVYENTPQGLAELESKLLLNINAVLREPARQAKLSFPTVFARIAGWGMTLLFVVLLAIIALLTYVGPLLTPTPIAPPPSHTPTSPMELPTATSTDTPEEVAVIPTTTATDTPVPPTPTNTPAPTDTPLPPTPTGTPIPTDTPIPTNTPTPTPTCADDAAFVSDVTVPDGTVSEPGEQIDKVWRLRNDGTCPWGEGYTLAFVSGDQMGAPSTQPVPAAAPGQTADVQVTMYAPQQDGTYKGFWQMQNPSGQLFGQTVVVVIVVQTPTPTATLTPTPVPPKVNLKDGAEMVYIPAGEFTMGSSDDDKDADSDEKPQHKVYLDAFWIYKTEVTNAQYRKCVEARACTPLHDAKYYDDPDYADHPVVYVDWHQAKAYSEWAGGRLPTEAEWEKAARGHDGRRYPWGDEFDKTKCNTSESGIGKTTSVGKYPAGASPYGALGMAGNVREWTSSLYKSYPYQADDGREDMEAGGSRVVRGGSWRFIGRIARCAFRLGFGPDLFGRHVGFRVVSLAAF